MNQVFARLFDRLDLAGTVGSLVAAACCLGLAPVLAVLTALGMGFLIRDAVLLPLLVLFLAVSLAGLVRGFRRHRNRGPIVAGLLASLGLMVFLFVWYRALPAYLAMGLLVAATTWNLIARRRCERRACETG